MKRSESQARAADVRSFALPRVGLPGWFGWGWRFALITLVVMAAVGWGLINILSDAIITFHLNQAEGEARKAVATSLSTRLTEADLATPFEGDRLAEMDAYVRANLFTRGIVRIKIWSPGGQVLYADDPAIIGTWFATNHEVSEALEGHTVSERPRQTEENASESGLGPVLEVYTPIVLPGSDRVVGVYEVYEEYTAIAHDASITRRYGRLVLGGGLILCYLGLVGTALSQRTIRQRNKELERSLREQLHTEDARRRAEESLRTIADNAPIVLLFVDRDGRVGLAEGKALGDLGLVREACLGQSFDIVLAESPQLRNHIRRGLAGAELAVMVEHGDRTFETHVQPWRNAAGVITGAAVVGLDVTSRSRTEEAVRQAQKFESLGVLSGGIAHDFNNLLTTILGNIHLVQSSIPDDSPLNEMLDDARKGAERGAEVVRRLLDYSRPTVERLDAISLRNLLQETAALAGRALTPSVELLVEDCTDPDIALGHAGALQQVLMNLLVNARDAMPGGGRITVSRRVARTDERETGPPGLEPGAYHVISVVDTGSGVPSHLFAKIFDPFFTTKEVGKGTGLGLATSLGIARAHGGWLDLESELGRGASFRLWLPLAAAGATGVTPYRSP